MNIFDIMKDLSYDKKGTIDDTNEGEYNPFLTNRFFSFFSDTIFYANEMNMASHLDKKMQYDFFINSIRKRKRFSPWLKKDSLKDLELVKRYYGYSNEKAKTALGLLTKEQLKFIESKLNVGGKK